MGDIEPEDSTEESGFDHPDTESGMNSPGAFMSFRHGRERCEEILRAEFGGVL